MKKTITKPDGTVETIEGTPEEIVEYERRNGPVPVVAPALPSTDPLQLNFKWNHQYYCEIAIAQRGWWSVTPPRCTCAVKINPSDAVID